MAFKSLSLGPFPGGLNTRDNEGELSSEEIADALNVTIDERGAPVKRLGYQRRYVGAVGTGKVLNIFNWASRGFVIKQVGTGMHKDGAAAFHTWSTSARIGMCEFLGNLIMIHPVDGVRMYDGTTVTGPFANFPLGDTCAAWQNKCWFAGNPTNPARVSYTDIGAMTMGVNNFNEIREKDTAKVTCLTGAAGLDISGRPGLLAFKGESAYRIYDSSNGAYNTIDASIGCGSNIGAVSAYGRTYVVNERGIYYTNGIDPMVEVSQKIENVFHSTRINQDRADLYCAGRYQDRLWFALPRAGDTFNSLAFELNPQSGWIMAHTMAGSVYCSKGRGATDMIMGSPTVDGMVYDTHRTGADDGAAIASYLQAAWIMPAFGNKVNLRRIRFIGAGAFTATVLKDFEAGVSLPSMTVDISSNDPLYDAVTSEYDTDDYYGPSGFQEKQDFYSIAKCFAFTIRIEETSTLTRAGRQLLSGGAESTLGAWSLSRALVWVIDLGVR